MEIRLKCWFKHNFFREKLLKQTINTTVFFALRGTFRVNSSLQTLFFIRAVDMTINTAHIRLEWNFCVNKITQIHCYFLIVECA